MEPIRSDFLVIGSGLAGLTFALKVADSGTVNIITKKKIKESNTSYAQGGIAAVFSEEDDLEFHKNDTLVAGAGLCHQDAVEILVSEGPDRIRELIDWGVEFSKDEKEISYDLAREGGHSHNRIFHAKDMTGTEVERALIEKVKQHPAIHIYENHQAIELITEHHVLLSRQILRF